MKDGLNDIVGKQIAAVIFAKSKQATNLQVFLVFPGGECVEFYGENFSCGSGLDNAERIERCVKIRRRRDRSDLRRTRHHGVLHHAHDWTRTSAISCGYTGNTRGQDAARPRCLARGEGGHCMHVALFHRRRGTCAPLASSRRASPTPRCPAAMIHTITQRNRGVRTATASNPTCGGRKEMRPHD
jgi:hypothetical protein